MSNTDCHKILRAFARPFVLDDLDYFDDDYQDIIERCRRGDTLGVEEGIIECPPSHLHKHD